MTLLITLNSAPPVALHIAREWDGADGLVAADDYDLRREATRQGLDGDAVVQAAISEATSTSAREGDTVSVAVETGVDWHAAYRADEVSL